jgi:hypothetical protein
MVCLPESTFSGAGLKQICIPRAVEVIDRKCFQGCSSLQQVSFPAHPHIRELAETAFMGCSSLRSFRIPSSVDHVGLSCFSDCDSLTTIVVEFGSPLPRDLGSFVGNLVCLSGNRRHIQVIWESAAAGVPGETFDEYDVQPGMDDEFLEGWSQSIMLLM